MLRINKISLRRTLPDVFVGDETSQSVSRSQIWLQDVDFVRPEVCLVSAESGTGKSSMCSFIFGSRNDYRGSILFDGEDTRGFSVERWCELRRRHLACLPQEMRLFPELTVMENLLIKNRLTDWMSEADIVRMLQRMEIEHKADVAAGLLSVGQQQRVAVVRALCQPMDFLILDEPVSHLDGRNNLSVAALIADETGRQEAGVITTSVGNHLQLSFTATYEL